MFQGRVLFFSPDITKEVKILYGIFKLEDSISRIATGCIDPKVLLIYHNAFSSNLLLHPAISFTHWRPVLAN